MNAKRILKIKTFFKSFFLFIVVTDTQPYVKGQSSGIKMTTV